MKTFKLHLIRHGLTQGNIDGIYVGGGLDIPLCQQGIEEVKEMKRLYRYPNVGLVFSSPMKRALQTAELLYPEVTEKIIVEDLRENNFGKFEGKKVADLMQDEDFKKWLDPKSGYVPENGESGEEFGKRTAKALMNMLEYQARANITEAACITHGGVIMSMLGQKGIPQKPFQAWMTDNACGFTVQVDAAMIMRDELVEVVQIIPHGYMER